MAKENEEAGLMAHGFPEFERIVRLELSECLEKFPELGDVDLMIELTSEELSGAAEGHLGDQRVVVLLVPPALLDKPRALRPIIFHELSHMIDKENPDRIFLERADEPSKETWRKLQEAKVLKCVVER